MWRRYRRNTPSRYSMKQVSVQLPTSADIVTLLAFAAKRRAAGGVHPKRPQTQPQTKTATD